MVCDKIEDYNLVTSRVGINQKLGSI